MSEIKLPADSGGGSVSFKGPATTTGNAAVPFVLPVADGSAGQLLKTDGSKNLGWVSDSSGSWVKLSQVLNGGNVSDITFTSLDTSTYRSFKFIGGMQPVTDDINLRMRFRVGSSDLTTAKYDWGYNLMHPDNAQGGHSLNDQDHFK